MVGPADGQSLFWMNVLKVQLKHEEKALSQVIKCTPCARARGTFLYFLKWCQEYHQAYVRREISFLVY